MIGLSGTFRVLSGLTVILRPSGGTTMCSYCIHAIVPAMRGRFLNRRTGTRRLRAPRIGSRQRTAHRGLGNRQRLAGEGPEIVRRDSPALRCAPALAALRDEHGELERLLVVQARIDRRAVSPLQGRVRQTTRTSCALGDVIAG